MAAIPNVLPGEVIRASLINQLIDAVNAGGTTVPSGVAVPDVFGMPLAQARTTITQPSVNLTLGSVFDVFGNAVNPNASISAARLVLGQVPPANTRVPVGSAVNLTVAGTSSGGGGTSPGLPIGDVFVGGGIPPVGNINQNSVVEFRFPITAAVNLQETYDLTPVIVGVSQPALWKARVVTGTVVTEITEITIPAAPPPTGATVQVRVEVTVPNGTNGSNATLALQVTSQRNAALTDTSSPITFTVGSAAPPPETIGILFQSVSNGTAQGDGTVLVQTGPAKSRLTYQATVPNPGTYDVTFDTTPAGYTVSAVGGTAQSTASTQLVFRVDASKTGTPAPGTLKIRVKEQANPTTVFGTEDQKLA
jgi:hypothetical protein